MKKAIAEIAVEVCDGTYAKVTIAIGSAKYSYDGLDPEDLVNLSDQQMCEEKERTHPDSRLGKVAAAAG